MKVLYIKWLKIRKEGSDSAIWCFGTSNISSLFYRYVIMTLKIIKVNVIIFKKEETKDRGM